MVSIFSKFKSFFKKEPKQTTVKKTITPTKASSVRAVDVGTSTQTRTGGFTITSGGSRGGGGATTTVSQIEGITKTQAESFAGESIERKPLPITAPSLPKAKTIESQLKASPSSIDLPPTQTERVFGIGTRATAPPQKFGSELFKKAGREFFFVEGTPVQAIGTLSSPFQKFFKKKVGEEEIQVPQFGTISTETPTGFKETTGFELAREQAIIDPSLILPLGLQATKGGGRIQKELVSELQPKVTSGELTLEEAKKEFGTRFGERFEKEVTPSITRSQEFQRGLGELEKPTFDVKGAGELVGIGALSLTPTGSLFVGTSFVAEGLPKITGGEGFLERGLGVAEVGIGLGVGGLATKQAERLIDRAFIQELQSKRGLVIGRETAKFEEGALFDTTSIRKIGAEGKIKTRLVTPVFQTGGDTFSITGGRGKSTLEFFSIERGEIIKGTEEFGFGGRQFVSKEIPKLVSKDLSLELGGFKGASGRGFIQKKGAEEFTQFSFGGVSKDIKNELGKITKFQSGRLEGLKLGDVTELPKGGKLFGEATGKFGIEESGVIRRLVSQEGTGVKFQQPSKITKTPFQVTFQESELKAPIGLSTGIEKKLFKSPQIIKPVSKGGFGLGIGIPRAVGGGGLTQEQIVRGQGKGFIQQDFQQPGLLPPSSRSGLVQPVFISSGSKTSERTIGGLSFKTLDSTFKDVGQTGLSIQRPRTNLREAQTTGQISKQLLVQDQEFDPGITIPKSIVPFDSFIDDSFKRGFRFPPLPSLGGGGDRPKRKKKSKAKVPIRPSFTGIVLGIQEAAFVDKRFGVLPGQIRGLETGFKVPKRKKKSKKK